MMATLAMMHHGSGVYSSANVDAAAFVAALSAECAIPKGEVGMHEEHIVQFTINQVFGESRKQILVFPLFALFRSLTVAVARARSSMLRVVAIIARWLIVCMVLVAGIAMRLLREKPAAFCC